MKNWLKPFLSEDDLKTIETHVAKGEMRTSGEIVPMIVRKSSTVGHVPYLLFFILFFAMWMSGLWQWQLTHFSWSPFFILLGNLLAVILCIRVLAPRPWIQRWLTPREDQIEQVNLRALNEFYSHRLHHTKEATGILLFVSLMEHRAVVLADKTINSKISGNEWNDVITEMVKGIKNDNLCHGLCRGIDLCADILSMHFPIQANDRNELKNHLIVLD